MRLHNTSLNVELWHCPSTDGAGTEEAVRRLYFRAAKKFKKSSSTMGAKDQSAFRDVRRNSGIRMQYKGNVPPTFPLHVSR